MRAAFSPAVLTAYVLRSCSCYLPGAADRVSAKERLGHRPPSSAAGLPPPPLEREERRPSSPQERKPPTSDRSGRGGERITFLSRGEPGMREAGSGKGNLKPDRDARSGKPAEGRDSNRGAPLTGAELRLQWIV